MAVSRVATALLKWYDAKKRDLPWRGTRDPYAIWVSETMLQQTTVAAVVPHYLRWMQRFPTVESLARARVETVLSYWQGLGYYRRARNLHSAAKVMWKAGVPLDFDGWRELPGVGDYTAGAVCSIAFNLPVEAVDANVQRVYARATRSTSSVGAREWAAALLQDGRSGDINQALMDLGATICRPKAPDCRNCPLMPTCECARRGDASHFPPAKPRKKQLEKRQYVVVAVDGDRLGVSKFEPGEWWEGMYGFPRLAKAPKSARLVGTVRHTVTHHRIDLDVYLAQGRSAKLWKTPSQLERLAMPSPDRRILRLVLHEIGSKPTGTARLPSSAKK